MPLEDRRNGGFLTLCRPHSSQHGISPKALPFGDFSYPSLLQNDYFGVTKLIGEIDPLFGCITGIAGMTPLDSTMLVPLFRFHIVC